MSTSPPVARVLSVRLVRRVRVVRVACPFCRHVHTHGWPPESLDVGFRVSHCHRPNGEPARTYRIDAVGGVR